jgi:endonuclease/exonuclease/phosphatase (EEP) superfamily protein YafD
LPRFLSALPFGLPIDHILLSRDVALRRLEAVPIAGSDHMARRAELIVPPREDRP